MEGGSEVEKVKPPEGGGGGEGKSKRKMKTASQLQILEKTYAVEQYPPEAMRAELSAQLGLSDRQLQMWFCHRRLKDRKARQPKDTPAAAPSPEVVATAAGPDVASGPIPGTVAGPGSFPHPAVDPSRAAPRVGTAVARISRDFPPVKRYYEPQLSMLERRAIASVEAQLGEPLRDDGPILGMEFDSLPPDAFGAPIGGHHKPSRRIFQSKYERPDAKLIKDVRPVQEYQFLPEKPTVRSEMHERAEASYNILQVNEQVPPENTLQGQLPTLNLLATPPGRQGQPWTSGLTEYAADPRKNSFMDVEVHGVHPAMVMDPLTSSERRIAHNEEVLRTERKRKSEEARIARELEAHEKRIRKELKRQDILRRKAMIYTIYGREEQIRKEMERHDRERRKEEERLLREKQREEERYLREQRRELERREKYLQKESMRAEKMRQKEEVRRMKEAARLKAASERAIARRIAKESMELMEDGKLELMEVAASSKGLPSIASLDYETLQNLDLFGDLLTAFPPKSVPLRRPFAVQPWLHSEENVANLLMDARLLSEIHISLLKTIIKDIEDVARASSMGLGANQNGAANPGGGHPHLVEGAYAWGFDIRSWQRHLNPLTWPEILRQFALSAGFGPQLKKKDIESAHLNDDNTEVNNGENVISILRDGTAAENAFAKMQERGYSSLRRSRHRLTPGTVKFAAFHVLSVEGSDGLNILEVAERIQKSGLRDLSTSKTPEASIAAALSRDTKLFERTAPSTYCVRATYRKDPVDAEAVLSAARERIRTFKSGMMEGEEEADDAERDEDSESDSGEDPEVDDLGTESNLDKEVHQKVGNRLNLRESLGNGIESNEIRLTQVEIPQSGLKDASGVSTMAHSPDLCRERGTIDDADINDEGIENNLDEQETDIDGSIPVESWVEGLMEGEYSDLSVEERLGALVALIGVAIEGNTIRLVLEERLEAATALKKQMWAEAQLDKRRFREDYVMKTYYPSQTSLSASGKQSPAPVADDGRNCMPVDPSMQQEQMIHRPTEENLQILDNFGGPEVLSLAQAGYAAERSRSQLKSYIGYKAEEMYVYRSLPLGQDRRRNRYWRFATSASRNDPGCGRIFVELRDGQWRLIDSEEGFDALLAVLDVRGIREANLYSMLRKIEPLFKEIVRRNFLDTKVKKQSEESPSSTVESLHSDASEASTSFLIELPGERNGALKRYQEFENWMWRECLSSSVLCAAKFGNKRCVELLRGCVRCHEVFAFEEENCPSCHKNGGTSTRDAHFLNHRVKREEKLSTIPASDFNSCGPVSSPVRIRSLEASIPSEAIADVWTDFSRKFWGAELSSSSSAGDLLQALTLLESAIKRDYLSSKFETTTEVLGLSSPINVFSVNKNVPLLPWVPKTTAAVALRLMELDSAISYTLNQKAESERDEGVQEHSKLSLRYALPSQGIAETSYRNDPFGEESWVDSGGLLGSSSRGRGTRGRTRARATGLRSQRRTVGSRSVTRKRSEKSGDVVALRGRPRGRGGRKRGRSARNRQKAPIKATQRDVSPEKVKPAQFSAVDNAWNDDENELLPLEESENSSSSERFDYGEENGQDMGYEYDDAMVDNYHGGFGGKSDDLMEGNEFEEEEEDEDEELGVEGYVDGQESDEVGMRRGDAFGIQNMGPEEDAAAYTSSDDYSDEDEDDS
ncbi:hypothetical protein CDL15_Pgr002845 [Punica granatum]|uniref:Uncharacterized protein n=1 Tax=Punica granatum TaxID=22663 RepID=A0A218X124_PUNGR|nr:hypothetical protein CDL15_Pgr002845 [Punica granatum]